jgi:NitT/TauT family transport system substrate-binding protein
MSRREDEMSARETKISRRLLMAAGTALGLALLSAPASSQTLEKVTYLFPAPPVLPAFGPIRLAQGKGYFTAAGLDVSFAVGRGGVDGKQVGAGMRRSASWRTDRSVRGNGVPVKIVAVFGGKDSQLVVREDSASKNQPTSRARPSR